jgi:biopolymer transport protein ExbD
MRIGSFAMAVVTLAAVLGTARAEESKVALGDVPKAGVDAVKIMFPQGEITGAAKETEDGKTVYEVTLKQKGRTIDVTVGTDGQIQIVEKEISLKELHAAVRQSLEAKYPQASYKIVEQVEAVKDGKLTLDFFEALIVTAQAQTLEVQIAPDGKIKAEEKKQADKD